MYTSRAQKTCVYFYARPVHKFEHKQIRMFCFLVIELFVLGKWYHCPLPVTSTSGASSGEDRWMMDDPSSSAYDYQSFPWLNQTRGTLQSSCDSLKGERQSPYYEETLPTLDLVCVHKATGCKSTWRVEFIYRVKLQCGLRLLWRLELNNRSRLLLAQVIRQCFCWGQVRSWEHWQPLDNSLFTSMKLTETQHKGCPANPNPTSKQVAGRTRKDEQERLFKVTVKGDLWDVSNILVGLIWRT